MVLSADTENDPDVSGINGASVALSVSDIPFHGPIGAVRVGRVNGEFVINPTYDEQRAGDLNLMVVGTSEGIVMIESGAKEVTEDVVVDGIEFGHEQIKKICAAITDLAKKVGKPKRKVEPPMLDQDYLDDLRTKMGERLTDAVNTEKYPKSESYGLIKKLKDEMKATIDDEDMEGRKKATATSTCCASASSATRCSRRSAVPMAASSTRFAISGSKSACCRARTVRRSSPAARPRRWSPPRSGTKDEDMQRSGGLRRRSLQALHAALQLPAVQRGRSWLHARRGPPRNRPRRAGRARSCSPCCPSETDFPYTMRVVSDILESNGSVSMATVCGASLA